MIYERQCGVPKFRSEIFCHKRREYALLIPVINEGTRIQKELSRGKKYSISAYVDIIICDGGSSDESMDIDKLKRLDVNSILVKEDIGRQGAQLRMGIWWALERGYKGIITIDGNNKDSIEDVPRFVDKLEEGFDFIQGSRFIKGGRAIRTPLLRLLALRLIHAPVISVTAGCTYTDTTNNYRGYSAKYLKDKRVQPFRDIFISYELLAFLSVRANQIGMKTCEIPVTRAYPKVGKTPTKIGFFKGNAELLLILLKNALGGYNP